MGLEEYGFIRDVTALLVIGVPAAVGFALWRVFVTNHSESQQLVSLGIGKNNEALKPRVIPGVLVRLSTTLISFIAVYLIGPDNLETFLSELLKDAEFFVWFGQYAVGLSY